MASNITVDTLTKGSTTLNTDEIVDTNSNQICKAWVSFVGTGTVSIRDSYNVTSITDRGTGKYTVNLTTAMSNANYAVVATAQKGTTDDGYIMGGVGSNGYTSSAIQLTFQIGGAGPDDVPVASAAVFSN